MTNDRLSELVRGANPVVREPMRLADVAWSEIVSVHERARTTTTPRLRAPALRTSSRRLLALAAAVLLIAGVSTFVSVNGSHNSPSLSNAIARAFGVVNANAASSGGFSTVPSGPQGSNRMTCPSSEVCYLESTNIVGNAGSLVTKSYKTTDGGTNWSLLTTPSAGSADTAFSCSSVSVCSVGFLDSPAGSHVGPFQQGTVQSILTTIDGGATWTSFDVVINPVLGYDATVDASLVNVQGQWSQLQCFSATSCIAEALVPSDQPQGPLSSEGAGSVQRTVIMRTDDGGAAWTSTVLPWSSAADGSPGWSNAQPMELVCSSELDCLGLSTVFHSVVNNAQTSNVKAWRSSDGGVTWSSAWAPAPAIASNPASSFTCPTTSRCFAIVQTGAAFPGKPEIMTTSDGGMTWTFVNPVAAGSGGSEVTLESVSCSSASTCWTAGDQRLNGTNNWSAAMWATNNSGATWISVPLPDGLGIVFQVVCNSPAACLAIAQPPYRSGQSAPTGPLPGEILSNQS
jgi:hypothetical protein